MANVEPIGLKELIAQVKRELLEEHDETQPMFVVGAVELQISFTAERDANGGIDIKIIQAGAAVKETDVQSVKVTLEPIIGVEDVKKSLTPEQLHIAAHATTRGDSGRSGSPPMSRGG